MMGILGRIIGRDRPEKGQGEPKGHPSIPIGHGELPGTIADTRRYASMMPGPSVKLSNKTPFIPQEYPCIVCTRADEDSGKDVDAFTVFFADEDALGRCLDAVCFLEDLADRCMSMVSSPIKQMHIRRSEFHAFAGDFEDIAIPRLEPNPLTPTGRAPKYPMRVRMNNASGGRSGMFFYGELNYLPDGSIGKADLQYVYFGKIDYFASFRIQDGSLMPSVITSATDHDSIVRYSSKRDGLPDHM